MADARGIGGASVKSIGALTLLGRPLGRLTASVDATGGWADLGRLGQTKVLLSPAPPTMRLEGPSWRRRLPRPAIARGCRSSSGKVSISRMSCALIAADSSALSFSPTGEIRGLPFRNGLALIGAGAGRGLEARTTSTVCWTSVRSLVTSGGASRSSSPAIPTIVNSAKRRA